MFGAIWTLAGIGILTDSLPQKGRRILLVVLYLTMGWLILLAPGPLVATLPRAGLLGLVAGGPFYTFGVIFCALDSRFPWAHGVWHLFVFAGSISHYQPLSDHLDLSITREERPASSPGSRPTWTGAGIRSIRATTYPASGAS
jgi:channel protein (hemolysin III family)